MSARRRSSSLASSLANVIPDFAGFRDEGVRYTVSGRRLPPGVDAVDALCLVYDYVDLGQIESVYGATTIESQLYGGWLPSTDRNSALTQEHVAALETRNLGIILTLSNHAFDEESYVASMGLLSRFHRTGNGVICVNDRLAARIRKDFPLYHLEASSIKRLNTHGKVARALELYDSVVVPSEYNKSDEFLAGIREKARVILFANSICDHECVTHECYQEVSKRMRTGVGRHERVCFKWIVHPNVNFDVRKLHGMGFSRFKLVPIYYERTERLIEEYRSRRSA